VSEAVWRRTRLSPTWRIEEAARPRLIEKFSGTTESPRTTEDHAAVADGDGVVLVLDDTAHRLDAATAAELRESIGDALSRDRSFLHTACERRPDGAYVVHRRNADSDGHSKVFESEAAARALFEELPREFVADDVGRAGISGNRRHLLVHHFAEHPAYSCTLVSKQPLTARKS
jgi:hypothetical protein